MKISKHKTKTVAIAFVLLMASVMLMANVPVVPVQAQEIAQSVPGPLPAGVTPSVSVPTVAYLSFRPVTIGLGQPILVNMWVSPGCHQGRQMTGYELTITDPDGNEEIKTIDAEPATNAIWFEYIPDQVGEWKLKFDFPGGYFANATVPPGFMETGPQTLESAYYQSSFTGEQTLTVQQDIVYSWPPSPLPKDYWTRPVDFVHREWWPILGNYPAYYDGLWDPEWDTRYPNTNPYWSSQYDFTPWVQGPNTAHIVWKRQGDIGGLIGGQVGSGYGITANPGNPDIVYEGRGYQDFTRVVDGETVGIWQCYDIRTGEVFWEQTAPTTIMQWGPWTFTSTLVPNLIEYDYLGGVAGSYAEGSRTFAVNLMAISGGRLYKWDPWDGRMTLNRSIAPLTGSGGTYYRNQHVLAVRNIGNQTDPNYRLINWTTEGTTSNFDNRILTNTSYARSSLPSLIDWEAGLGATVSRITQAGVYYQIVVRGYNLYTGAELWNTTVEEPLYSGSCTVADHGKVAALSIRGYWLAWDLASGNLAWTSEKMDYPWDQCGFGAYSSSSAYGMFFRQAYSGVYAFNWTDGKIVWKYEKYAPAAFESPYTTTEGVEVYSDNTGVRIADGKVYTYNCEHSQTWPRTRGWSLNCINVTTGDELWSIGLAGTAAFGDTPDIGPIADGYMSMAAAIGIQYVFGKGKSATTVTAPQTSVPLGTAVLIQGTVLDMSPAQPGTACVSKESMTLQMEYLHLQTSIHGLWGDETVTGVPVTLLAIDSDNNVFEIGTTTSDMSGSFQYAWTPPDEGLYKITASFLGDDSYGSSWAETGLSVGPAPPEPTEPIEPEEAPAYTAIDLAIIAAVVVAIVIGVVNLWALRKRT